MAEKKTLGRLPREAIRMLDLPRLPRDVIESYAARINAPLRPRYSDARRMVEGPE